VHIDYMFSCKGLQNKILIQCAERQLVLMEGLQNKRDVYICCMQSLLAKSFLGVRLVTRCAF